MEDFYFYLYLQIASGVRATGTVKWFNGERGYRYIPDAPGEKDVFIDIGALNRSGHQSLEKTQKNITWSNYRKRREGQR
jgi:CspA family cold shock protein